MNLPKDLTITCTAEEEFDSIEHAAKDCAPGFAEQVRETLKESPDWGWCSVKVSVSASIGEREITGSAYLGHCSYYSREDFVEDSGYFDQMVAEAKGDLAKQLVWYYADLAGQLESLADGEDDDLGQLLMLAATALRANIVEESLSTKTGELK